MAININLHSLKSSSQIDHNALYENPKDFDFISSLAEQPAQPPFKDFPLPFSPILKLNDIPYVLCNEEGQRDVLTLLESIPHSENGIHLGFSCWFNYDCISIRSPSKAIICDIDQNTIAVLNMIKRIVADSKNSDQFMELFWKALQENPDLDFPGLIAEQGECLNYDRFCLKMKTNGGWLSSEEHFEVIKRMYRDGLIIHCQLNIAKDVSAFDSLQQWAIQNKLSFDTIYISNIPEWLFIHSKDQLSQMKTNLNKLLDAKTYVLSAWKKMMTKGSPELHFGLGSIPEMSYDSLKKRPYLRLRRENSDL